MESVVLGVDPIILSGKIVRTGMPVVFDYSRRYEHMLVYVDGEKKGALPMGIAVKPGIHQIALKTGENTMPLYQEVIHVSEGDEIPLPVLLYGYDQGTTFRVGYQGFLNDEVDRSVAKPLMMYGLAYSNYSLFGPQLGVRADASYGQANQTLTVGSITTSADVTQTSYGMALLYRYASGGMSVYGGPRLGRIEIKRQLAVGELGSESDGSTTVGGIIGLHFRHKKNISFALESALNYANIELVNNNSSAYFYSVFGELSINF